jgi:hypothetical protein
MSSGFKHRQAQIHAEEAVHMDKHRNTEVHEKYLQAAVLVQKNEHDGDYYHHGYEQECVQERAEEFRARRVGLLLVVHHYEEA